MSEITLQMFILILDIHSPWDDPTLTGLGGGCIGGGWTGCGACGKLGDWNIVEPIDGGWKTLLGGWPNCCCCCCCGIIPVLGGGCIRVLAGWRIDGWDNGLAMLDGESIELCVGIIGFVWGIAGSDINGLEDAIIGFVGGIIGLGGCIIEETGIWPGNPVINRLIKNSYIL